MATRIAIMSGGHVRQIGTPREVYDKPVDRFVADFVGETNFLAGRVIRDGGRSSFELPDGSRVTTYDGAVEGEATLMIRPEYLSLRRRGSGEPGDEIAGRIVNVAFLGTYTRITLATPVGEIAVIRPHGSRATSTEAVGALGEEVAIWWSPDDAALIRA